jgi:tetratricopeptide (TPR) repeat protein
MKKIIILLLSFILVKNGFCQTSEEFYNKGLVKYELKDYKGAIEDYTKAIDLTFFSPDDQIRKKLLEEHTTTKQIANYFLGRGHAKFELKDYQGAEKDFWNVKMLLPGFIEGPFQQGKAYFELQEFSLSVFAFTEAIEIDSNDAEVFFRRGLAKYQLASPFSYKNEMLDDSLTHKGNYNDAIADFTKSLELHCCPAEVYYQRGRAKGQLGDYIGAIDDQTNAIKIDSNNAWTYQERGIAKFQIKDYQGAIEDFNISLKISPNARSYRSRGIVKMLLEDFRGAIEDCNLSIKLDPSFPTAYMTRGMAKIHLNQKESGCLDLSKAGELGMTDAYEEIKRSCNK